MLDAAPKRSMTLANQRYKAKKAAERRQTLPAQPIRETVANGSKSDLDLSGLMDDLGIEDNEGINRSKTMKKSNEAINFA